jgi:putative endonuclease
MGLTVYILLCGDGTYYTGVTSNMDRRLAQHETGYFDNSYTSHRLPVKLLWGNFFQSNMEAISWEKRIKKWSKKKKEALIRGDFDALRELSICKNDTHYRNYGSSKG